MLDRGILGINRRNNSYIKEFNPKKGIRLANNKHQTKKFLTQRGIPTPNTIAYIKTRQDRLSFDFGQITQTTFVIKPNKGSKGNGIFVIQNCRKKQDANIEIKKDNIAKIYDFFGIQRESMIDFGYEFLVGSTWVPEYQFKLNVVGICDGKFSSTNKEDTILIEEKLVPGKGFAEFCTYGLADMRIIMFKLVPIIAMLRVPTKQSGGKANLAQGGIGLGLDIVTGKITTLYQDGKSYTNNFPEERNYLKNKKIPYRQEIIQYSANTQYFVNIGYLGMDWVITEKGPKLLEINARSGLEIQNITGKPLLTMMQKIEDLDVTTPNKGIEISKSLFSDERINEIKEQNIIYLSQTGKISYKKDDKKRALPVTITVGLNKLKNYTSEKVIKRLTATTDISLDLGHHDTVFKNIKLIASKEIQGNKIIIGQQSLESHYIKPIHKSKVSIRNINPNFILQDEIVSGTILDDKISMINKQLNLAKILQPVNYLDEFDKFVSLAGLYNPQFRYDFPTYKHLHILTEQIKELNEKYNKKEYFDSTFSNIFFEKLDEMLTKINLIKAYKKQNFGLIDRYNRLLFGELDETLLDISKEKIANPIAFKSTQLGRFIKGDEAIQYIKEYVQSQRLAGIKIKKDDSMLSKISVGFGRFATIKVKNTAIFREIKLVSKLVHEIDVHVMRYLNGKKSGRNIFATGTAGYLETEEGLSVYMANKKIQETIPGYDGVSKYKNYYFVAQSRELSFSGLAMEIIKVKKILSNKKIDTVNYKVLFNTTLRFMKGKKDTSKENTGIMFGKNLVYLNGYKKIEQLITDHPEKITKLLQYGKCKISDLEYMK